MCCCLDPHGAADLSRQKSSSLFPLNCSIKSVVVLYEKSGRKKPEYKENSFPGSVPDQVGQGLGGMG